MGSDREQLQLLHMGLDSASSTSAPVKWKAPKVSAKRDFFTSMDSDGKSIGEQDITPRRQDCLELFQHNVGSQEKVVEVNQVIMKQHKLEPEKVKPSVGADMKESVQLGSEFALDLDEVVNQVKVDDIENSESEFLTIRLYPSPKKRNIPVDRDFTIGLVQFAQQVEQEMNKPLVSNNDNEREQRFVNTRTAIFCDVMMLESERLEMVVTHDQDESVKEESTYLTDLRSSSVANVPRKRVSVIRCFPPGCGRDAVCLSEEDLKRALADSKNHCLSCKEDDYEVEGMMEDEAEVMDEEEEQVVVEQEMNKPLVSNGDIESEQRLVNTRKVIFRDDMMLESDRLEMVVAHDQDESVKEEFTYLTDSRSSTVANVPRRRVSAIRCFPPGCGRDAVYLNEEDLERALADSKNHCLSCKEDDSEVVGMMEDEAEVIDEEEQVMVEQEDGEMEEGKENDDEVMEEEDEGEEDDVEVEEEGEEDDVEVTVVEEEGEEDNVEVEEEEEEEGEEDDVEVEVEEEEKGEEDNVEVELVEEEEGEEDDDEVEVVEQEEVVMMTHDDRETMETKFEGQRVLVVALKASRCLCSQNAGAEPRGTKPTAGGLKKGKEIITTDFKKEERVVVQALMASSSPWRSQNQRRPTRPKFIR